MKNTTILKRRLEYQTGYKLKEIEKDFEVGKKYYCGYWCDTFEVLEITSNRIFDKLYVCKWSNGNTTTHATRPAYDDFEIIE